MATRIHVTDDERHITIAIRLKLQKAGFDVETSDNGEAALAAIQENQPAMLITDYQMPRMDGYELCRRLRRDPATSDMPVIMLTAKGYEMDIDQLKNDLKIDHIIVKPFSPRELLATVHQCLGVTAESR